MVCSYNTRLKSLFKNKEHVRLLRWNKKERKKDGKLRHPADGSQWRNIEREFKDFIDEERNLWFGLSIDDFNPFGDQSPEQSSPRYHVLEIVCTLQT